MGSTRRFIDSTDKPDHPEQLHHLVQALPWTCELHFAIGVYHLQCYLPNFKIAVEYTRDQSTDTRRVQFITHQLTCQWVRVAPDVGFVDVLRQILQLIPLALPPTPFYHATEALPFDLNAVSHEDGFYRKPSGTLGPCPQFPSSMP